MLNPIIAHKREKGWTWNKMAEETGIAKNTLLQLRHMSPKQVTDIRLKTIVTVKDKLGIDLVEYYRLSLTTKASATKETEL